MCPHLQQGSCLGSPAVPSPDKDKLKKIHIEIILGVPHVLTCRKKIFELEPPVGGSVPYVKSLVLTGGNQGWPGLHRLDLQIYK